MLAPDGVGVLTIKLGYMDTRLAYGVAPPALTCSPHYAAKAIRRSIERPPHGRLRSRLLAPSVLHSPRHTGAPFPPSSDTVTGVAGVGLEGSSNTASLRYGTTQLPFGTHCVACFSADAKMNVCFGPA